MSEMWASCYRSHPQPATHAVTETSSPSSLFSRRDNEFCFDNPQHFTFFSSFHSFHRLLLIFTKSATKTKPTILIILKNISAYWVKRFSGEKSWRQKLTGIWISNTNIEEDVKKTEKRRTMLRMWGKFVQIQWTGEFASWRTENSSSGQSCLSHLLVLSSSS